jgi:uncharacterized repeat protein (TIGR01451 family)
VTPGTCAASLNSISGQLITINQAAGGCNINTTFTLNYNNATAPTPVSPPQTYTFVNQHGQDPTVSVTAPPNTDVSVTKVANATPISAGETASFTITAVNAASGVAATNVTITDTLPSGITWTISPTVAGCSISGGNSLSCTFATLASAASQAVTVTGATDAADCGTLNNTANVSATNDSTSGNNSASASIVVQCPDVRVQKVANPLGPVSAGDEIGFDVTLSNIGAGDATGVSFTDTLPSGLTWTIDPASTGWSIVGSSLTYTPTTLPAGFSTTVHVKATTSSATCGTVTNSASASATNEASDTLTNNLASASVTVNCPDLKVEKTADASPVNAGDAIGFTVNLSNIGTGTACGVSFTDTLPAGLTFTESSADWDISGGNLVFTPTTLAAGTSSSVHITATTSADNCGTVTNSASASATNEASDTLTNNSASASVTVNCPDISVTKTADVSPISAGDTAAFTIVVKNEGLGIARSVSLTDTLPAGVAWSTGTVGCSVTGGNSLGCTFGDLNAGELRTVNVSGTTDANDCGTLNNTANASATNEASTTLANNSASASIIVLCPDITVTKSADASSVNAGDPIGFSILVSNIGPGEAKSVTLSDSLPPGVGMVWTIDALNSDSSCTITGGNSLSCSFGNIPSTGSKKVHVTSPTTPANCGSVSNTATASATNERASDATNNSSTAVIVLNDVTAPVITLNGQTITLWSPNHKYTTVRVTDLVASASDSCSSGLGLSAVYISKVTSDELENTNGGDGNTVRDMVIANDCKSVDLRAERDGSKNGRVYTITFKVTDAAGNIGTITTKVTVPHSQGAKGVAIDDGPVYTVTNPNCP